MSCAKVGARLTIFTPTVNANMLYITLGDPFSTNIELLHHVLLHRPCNYPIVIIGSWYHWQEQTAHLPPLALQRIDTIPDQLAAGIYFQNCAAFADSKPAEQLTAKERGATSMAALQALPRSSSPSSGYAVLTCPLDKHACVQAGYPDFVGHTEFFAKLYDCPTLMLLASTKHNLKVALATHHIALKEVAAKLSIALLQEKITLLCSHLRKYFACQLPRVAVCGLNPHCGDSGLCGQEEQKIINPAVQSFAQNSDLTVDGALPADSVFHAALQGKYDAVLAMYHDQGLAPLKALAFHDAVNITAGLPILRISPDHGTAQDLFRKQTALPMSMNNCFDFIDTYVQH